MNQQPDKLFRDKLKNYQKPVSSDAWNRVSDQMDQGKKTIWIKAAAAIPLLAVAGILLFAIRSNQPEITIAENTITSKQEAPKAKVEANLENSSQPFKNEEKESSTTITLKQERNRPGKMNTLKTRKNVQDKAETETVAEAIPVAPNKSVVSEENSFIRENDSLALNKEYQRITLEYSAEEVNEKYLNKNSLADATSEEKKTSTLRKLLDRAYELKHNQDPLGDLRQKKNELFAFNFKSDKQRNENK